MENKEIVSELESLKTRVVLLEKLVLTLIEEKDLPKDMIKQNNKNTNYHTYLDEHDIRRRII